MHRKNFLRTSAALVAGTLLSAKKVAAADGEKHPIKIPPYLKAGSVVGITSPAGFITMEEIQPAVAVLKSWGFEIKYGNTIGKRDFTFGGTDEERLNDLQQILDDKNVAAIMCARGGYGSVRIVDDLNWTKFIQHPKWLIGFSDITVLHAHIFSNCHAASIHSKMTNSFPKDWNTADAIQIETINSIRAALTGEQMKYIITANAANKIGTVSGPLIGGNLKTLETLSGTKSDLNTDGTILFVEDTGEYLYSIDRMFWNLKRTGKLKNLKGLIIGGFCIKPDDPGEEFGRTVQDIVLEKVKEYNYPVCFDFPVGHQKNNFALKCGVKHRLTITKEEVSLTETV
ncbi:MAG: LD-carboxypeptidase [Chitinophagaceae bacterium]